MNDGPTKQVNRKEHKNLVINVLFFRWDLSPTIGVLPLKS
jgi:hypothetical protein